MSKKQDKKKEAKEKKVETPMTSILDKLLEAGGTLEEITKKVAEEQGKRKGNRYKTHAGIIAHMRARATKTKDPVKYNVPLDKIDAETFVQAVAE